MPVVHPVCGGLDGQQAALTAWRRRRSDAGQLTTAGRACGTTFRDLLARRAGRVEDACPLVAMESPGVSGRPGSPVRAETGAVVVGNPQEMRQRPGQKPDKAAAPWSVERRAQGWLRPRCMPPLARQARRALTRTRVALVRNRSPAKHRMHKL
jgi:hypothetical protein